MLKCLYCGKEIPEDKAREIEEIGIEPFCSEYCCYMYSGVPMPWNS